MRDHTVQIKTAIIKNKSDCNKWLVTVEKSERLVLLGGVWNGAATMENSPQFLKNIELGIAVWAGIFTLGCVYPLEMHAHVCSSIIHKMETIPVSMERDE